MPDATVRTELEKLLSEVEPTMRKHEWVWTLSDGRRECRLCGIVPIEYQDQLCNSPIRQFVFPRLVDLARQVLSGLASRRERDEERGVRVQQGLCIYVAGPLSGAWRKHVAEAVSAGLQLIRRGHHPFVPHLSVVMDGQAEIEGIDVPYERWLALDFAWLARADAILYLAPSPGADRELAFAEQLGLRVFRSVDEVPDVARCSTTTSQEGAGN